MGSIITPTELVIPRTAFTPTVTAANVGDLTVAYSGPTIHYGWYSRKGSIVQIAMAVSFTPTYTTATGNIIIGGLPFPADELTVNNILPMQSSSTFTWPASATQINFSPTPNTTQGIIAGTKSGSSVSGLAITAIASGAVGTMRFRGQYMTNA